MISVDVKHHIYLLMNGYRSKKQKRHQKCRSSTVRGVHAALIVGSPILWSRPFCSLCQTNANAWNMPSLDKACWRPHSQFNVSKIISSFPFLFYHSKRSEFCTWKRLSHSSDHYQATWCAQLLFVCSCLCVCVCVCVCVCAASCMYLLSGFNNKCIRKHCVKYENLR